MAIDACALQTMTTTGATGAKWALVAYDGLLQQRC